MYRSIIATHCVKKWMDSNNSDLTKACSKVAYCEIVGKEPYLKAETLSCGGLGPSGAAPLWGKTLKQLKQRGEK